MIFSPLLAAREFREGGGKKSLIREGSWESLNPAIRARVESTANVRDQDRDLRAGSGADRRARGALLPRQLCPLSDRGAGSSQPLRERGGPLPPRFSPSAGGLIYWRLHKAPRLLAGAFCRALFSPGGAAPGESGGAACFEEPGGKLWYLILL